MTLKSSFCPRAVVLLCLCATCLAPAELRAWGQEGHRIIAAVAESRLQKHAAGAVQELVGDGNLSSVPIGPMRFARIGLRLLPGTS